MLWRSTTLRHPCFFYLKKTIHYSFSIIFCQIMKKGLLLINLGTPRAANTASVRAYLREFLSDPRVIQLPAAIRYILLYGIILPFRSKKSAKAYQSIWTPEGSPLLCHTQKLTAKVQIALSHSHQVVFAMRYGTPSIESGLKQLSGCDEVTVLPLYPQYSSAATGSSIEKTCALLGKKYIIPSVKIIRDFYNHPAYLNALADHIKPYITQNEFLLLSYHGVPENQILINECKTLCAQSCHSKSSNYSGCYRAQCHHTSIEITKRLQMNQDNVMTAFQSRLGRTAWIKPYTDHALETLAQKGIKKLSIACPSFVADCLETLEEIGMRASEQWKQAGGDSLTLIPALNDSDDWVNAICEMIKF